MADPMRIRARLKDDTADVRILMAHEMETGQRKNSSGELNDKPVLKAHWGPAIAKNPYLAFKIPGAKKGDKITVKWVDNKGDSRTDEATVN